ncbi:hypothetical protein DUNSADRAFT_10443 [Dunaliella salina]|uniref:DUF1664 domain-containing protein n=1 Tax=Dunaliella salina TaxID=3046 RepID=A0ABQ7GFE2_DUNSA|nr:hypothetical protein DUNSADRAFT_10443 [Dunaliella salina]|eukprot:KAF5833322.1 hypothetical protein DUNSADRAFT_10443 [Dunaliella salina]
MVPKVLEVPKVLKVPMVPKVRTSRILEVPKEYLGTRTRYRYPWNQAKWYRVYEYCQCGLANEGNYLTAEEGSARSDLGASACNTLAAMERRLGLCVCGYLMAGAAAKAYGMRKSNSSWAWNAERSLSGSSGTTNVRESPVEHISRRSTDTPVSFDAGGLTHAALTMHQICAQVDVLRGEVSSLTSMVSELNAGKPSIVLHQLSWHRGWSILYSGIASGACLYLYCKLTGTRLKDLLLFSHGSMIAFSNAVQEGLSNVRAEMRRQKEEFLKMVSMLGNKQDHLQHSQEQLMEKQQDTELVLQRVDGNVDVLVAKASYTIDKVKHVDGKLQDVGKGVQAANQGIYFLMAAFSEFDSKIRLHRSRALQSLHRSWKGYSSSGGSIADPPYGSSTTSSLDNMEAAKAWRASSIT